MKKALWLLAVLLGVAQTADGQASVTIEYYHLDAAGSVRAVTNESGQVVRRHDYFAFGEGEGVSAGQDPVRFTSQERDPETGLDYFGARYYAQRTGRFTSVDPVMNVDAALIDPQRWNRYVYVRNNPLRYVDPDGRELKLTIYFSGITQAQARAVADQVTANLTTAGVLNVTYDLRQGSPTNWETFRFEVLPTPHSHLLELRADRNGRPRIRNDEGGHNWEMWGGHSAVATSVVRQRTSSDSDFILGLANTATHEIAHDALKHTNSNDFMQTGMKSDWLFDKSLHFAPEQAKQLQRMFNRPNETQQPGPPTKDK